MKLLQPLLLLLSVVLVPRAAAEDFGPLFSRLDVDRDGRLTKGEVPQEQGPWFARLVRNSDSDDDGRLTLQELETGLTSRRPEKPLTEKAESKLPGSDTLLLMLAWMDQDANFTITVDEVPARLQPLFEQFVELLNEQNKSRIRIPQLRQQALRYSGLSARFAYQQGIDVELELSLLSDAQWAYVGRLKTSLRPGAAMADPGMADPERAAMLFNELDTNGDGKVAADEVPEPFTGRFAALLERGDRDQDKQLSEQEFKVISRRIAQFESQRPPLAETTQRAQQLLRRSDLNSDGVLTREEAPRRLAQRFDRLDESGDGKLDVDELSRAVETVAALRNSAGNRPVGSSPSIDRRGN